MVEDGRHEAPSGVCRRLLGDPLVEVMELLPCLRGEVDPARHERAAHFASNSARTSSAGIARDGSAFSASYAAAASV